mmetsp:Transcript_5495/g.17805  ORF Transcript_5495/g.17805 Transcript_5495/m.17805 type:complete len:216 (-) Transcript_5495:1410-2057(-)
MSRDRCTNAVATSRLPPSVATRADREWGLSDRSTACALATSMPLSRTDAPPALRMHRCTALALPEQSASDTVSPLASGKAKSCTIGTSVASCDATKIGMQTVPKVTSMSGWASAKYRRVATFSLTSSADVVSPVPSSPPPAPAPDVGVSVSLEVEGPVGPATSSSCSSDGRAPPVSATSQSFVTIFCSTPITCCRAPWYNTSSVALGCCAASVSA